MSAVAEEPPEELACRRSARPRKPKARGTDIIAVSPAAAKPAAAGAVDKPAAAPATTCPSAASLQPLAESTTLHITLGASASVCHIGWKGQAKIPRSNRLPQHNSKITTTPAVATAATAAGSEQTTADVGTVCLPEPVACTAGTILGRRQRTLKGKQESTVAVQPAAAGAALASKGESKGRSTGDVIRAAADSAEAAADRGIPTSARGSADLVLDQGLPPSDSLCEGAVEVMAPAMNHGTRQRKGAASNSTAAATVTTMAAHTATTAIAADAPGDSAVNCEPAAAKVSGKLPAKGRGKADAAAGTGGGDGKKHSGKASGKADAAAATGGGRGKKGSGKACGNKAPGVTRDMEEDLWSQGYSHVIGVDEAGRGPLAGPVVAAACIVPPWVHIEGIDDSKVLKEEQRERLYEALTSHPDVRWAIGIVDHLEIDRINILQAALSAMANAVAALTSPSAPSSTSTSAAMELDRNTAEAASLTAAAGSSDSAASSCDAVRCGPASANDDSAPESPGHAANGDGSSSVALELCEAAVGSNSYYCLVDGNRLPKQVQVQLPAQAVIGGDGKCYCIAAASVIAKVTRDRLMLQLHEQYPAYNFAQHKGYGVPSHVAALKTHGPCPAHRRSFEPIKSMTGWTRPVPPTATDIQAHVNSATAVTAAAAAGAAATTAAAGCAVAAGGKGGDAGVADHGAAVAPFHVAAAAAPATASAAAVAAADGGTAALAAAECTAAAAEIAKQSPSAVLQARLPSSQPASKKQKRAGRSKQTSVAPTAEVAVIASLACAEADAPVAWEATVGGKTSGRSKIQVKEKKPAAVADSASGSACLAAAAAAPAAAAPAALTAPAAGKHTADRPPQAAAANVASKGSRQRGSNQQKRGREDEQPVQPSAAGAGAAAPAQADVSAATTALMAPAVAGLKGAGPQEQKKRQRRG